MLLTSLDVPGVPWLQSVLMIKSGIRYRPKQKAMAAIKAGGANCIVGVAKLNMV